MLTDPMIVLALLALLAAAGAGFGVALGFLGVGGGVVAAPILYGVFTSLGLADSAAMRLAIGTALAAIAYLAGRAALRHRDHGEIDRALVRRWAPWAVVGAALGALAVATAPERGVIGLVGLAGFAIAGRLALIHLGGVRSARRGGVDAAALSAPGLGEAAPAAVGFVGAATGAGAGAFAAPLLKGAGLRPAPTAGAAATLGFGVALAAATVLATAGFWWDAAISGSGAPPLTVGLVQLPAAVIVAAAAQLTAPLGARLAESTPERVAALVFALALGFTAATLIRKAVVG